VCNGLQKLGHSRPAARLLSVHPARLTRALPERWFPAILCSLIIDTLAGDSYDYCNRLICTDTTVNAAVERITESMRGRRIYQPARRVLCGAAGSPATPAMLGVQARGGTPSGR
jgi:hypothetical protein